MVKLNTLVRPPIGYDPPSIPETQRGPDSLAELLIHARKWRKRVFGDDGAAGDAVAPISDGGLRKLIDLVFYTSLLPEEGRFPRFKLVSRYCPSLTVTRLNPVPLNDSSLRRLAPACTRPDCALLVAEGRNGLQCEGVVCVGGLARAIVLGRPGVSGDLRTAEMLIEVFGPGHFRATEVYPGYEYRAGRVRALTGFDAPPAAESLVKEILKRFSRTLSHREGWGEGAKAETMTVVMHFLARMLRTAVDARHGGAFVFLPSGTRDPASCGLEVLHHTAGLHLGRDLADLLDKCDLRLGGEARSRRSIADAEQSRAKLLTDAGMVANFSMVDGCVVLGRDLRVHGFGAKIAVTVEEASRGPQFKHVASGDVYENADFMKEIGGTRHQSVARLCQARPGAMVFTVSQDGDLKLFSSDAKHAYVYGPLDLPTIEGDVFVS